VAKSMYVKVSSPANIGGVMTECQVTVKSHPESNNFVPPTFHIFVYIILILFVDGLDGQTGERTDRIKQLAPAFCESSP